MPAPSPPHPLTTSLHAPLSPPSPSLLPRVYRRYLKLEPGHAEEYVEFLRSRGHWNEAAERLADIVNDDMFVARCVPSPPTAPHTVPTVRPHHLHPVTLTSLAPPSPQSLAGKTKHNLWLELCDIITKHPAEISTLPVEAILRGGIRKFTDEVGRLWVSLADFFIRRGLFEKARDVYEEARRRLERDTPHPLHARRGTRRAETWEASAVELQSLNR